MDCLYQKVDYIAYMPSLFDKIQDSFVVGSFDQNGFVRHQKYFDRSDEGADVEGCVALITGANSGIGFATALELTRRGMSVYLLCRNPERGQDAEDRIREATGSDTVYFHQLDLSDLNQVRDSAASLLTKVQKIDVFIHNAGILPLKEMRSAQGHELTLATNLLGHHLLTKLLWSRLQGRMILVSSGGMYFAPLTTKELFADSFLKFDGVRRYALTKRAQVALTEIWAKKGGEQGLVVHSMHPGWVATPGVEHSLPGFWKRMEHRLRDPDGGADTVVWLSCATKPLQSNGLFWFDRESRKTHIAPWQSHSIGEKKRLWERLEQEVAPYMKDPS